MNEIINIPTGFIKFHYSSHINFRNWDTNDKSKMPSVANQ